MGQSDQSPHADPAGPPNRTSERDPVVVDAVVVTHRAVGRAVVVDEHADRRRHRCRPAGPVELLDSHAVITTLQHDLGRLEARSLAVSVDLHGAGSFQDAR